MIINDLKAREKHGSTILSGKKVILLHCRTKGVNALKLGVVRLSNENPILCLSSNGDECDVSKIAELFGGGGHKNAAGFSLDTPGFDQEKGITLWSTPTDNMSLAGNEEESHDV